MEKKDYGLIGGLVVLSMLITGAGTYYVADTGEELVCRTGNGWEIEQDHGSYFDAVCQYKTTDWVYAKCSEFRATASKERYGCNLITLIEKESDISEDTEYCESQICYPPDISDVGCVCLD